MKPITTLFLNFLILCSWGIPNFVNGQTCSLTIAVTAQDSKCKATGSLSVTVTNGSGQYNYTVTAPGFTTTTSTNIIQGLMPATYSVNVKDLVSGCTIQKDNIVVGGNYQDPRFQLSATDVTCINGNNGSINVINVQYGKAPYYYTIIAPSASAVGTSNATGVFTNLISGDYSVQMSDSCGGLQTRVITISNYNWWITASSLTKLGCGTGNISLTLQDNKGNVNTSGTSFIGFMYGVINGPGDTTWTNARTFTYYYGTKRSLTFVAKDNCGNVQSVNWNDNTKPSVNANVNTNALTCANFSAQITGQQNLTSPFYCLYDNSGTQLTCNTTGAFNNLAYGSYCIKITDYCYDTTITRCFTVNQPTPSVASSVAISNLSCNTFTASITGQQNLTNPQYCIYDASNVLISCNTTGVFNGLAYGSYCINITDGCTGVVLNRCFTQKQPIPGLAANITFSNTTCNSFTANAGGQNNITNGQYCLYDASGVLITCNNTGVFTGLAYGSYCIQMQNDPTCYDTIIKRCFTAVQPAPGLGNNVNISNKTCSDFTASITGQQNLTNPQYCLYDNNNNLIICNTTGQFNNLAYGSYCITMHNDATCFDTSITRCFSAMAPVPSVSANVSITSKACSTFTATVNGLQNLTTPQFCLYDNSNTLITCNTTGQFTNLAYGSYCIQIVNTCYDTTISRCFTVNPVPISLSVNSVASCTIGTTTLSVNISNAVAPYTINVYNPGGLLVSTTTTNAPNSTITDLSGLPVGASYMVVVSANCAASDSVLVTPVASWIIKSINANSKCPGGQWQNGSGDLVVNAQYSGGTIIPKIIYKNGVSFPVNYSTQSGSNFTFTNMEPATYIIQYTLHGCATLVYDTFNLDQYNYPSLNKSAVYQCNNNSFSVSAAVNGGLSPFTYEIIGSVPAAPSIVQGPQASPTFAINNGTTYSVVRLRAIDACGNATINDASILPLGNIIVTSNSDCFYNNINLSVDNIPNATYTWYKKTSAVDSVVVGSGQSFAINYLLPTDTGTYVSVASVNSGCLTRISSFRLTGMCGGILAENGLAFTGAPEKDNVQLRWNTVSGFDANQFIVERSSDGVNFSRIGNLNAAANNATVPSQYLYSDINAINGQNFYRLRIVKKDGSIAYSKVIVISMGNKTGTTVMPNPVVDVFAVKFQQAVKGSYSLSLISAEGKQVFTNNYLLRTGETITVQRPNNITTGVYYLMIVNKGSNEKEVIKLFFK